MDNIDYRLAVKCTRRPVGLWEVNWEVDALTEYSTQAWIQEHAKEVVCNLLWNEWTQLYLNQWGTDTLIELPMGKALQVVQFNYFWVPPDSGEWCIAMRCTEKGEKHFGETHAADAVPVRP
jgi:hypothetical protein